MRLWAILLFLACTPSGTVMAADAGCHAPAPLLLRVRLADEAPRDALLLPAGDGGLVLLDPESRHTLWSAGPRPGTSQQITAMDAAFGASLTALHLDEDGLHDRIYAGDQAGRVWRLDLRAGARPSAWMRAGLLADLGVPEGGRGFLAAPDVTRIEIPGFAPWLNIALGTANIGAARGDHRFYVLRDALDAALPPAPLTEADLDLHALPLGVGHAVSRGFYLPLGTSQVLAPALTLNGFLHFTAVESGHSLLARCGIGTLPTAAVQLSVTVIRAEDGAVVTDRDGNGRIDQFDLKQRLPRPLPANSMVALPARTTGNATRLQCAVAGEPLPECFLDIRPRRTWWRREDAD